jgi:hypothetical protein
MMSRMYSICQHNQTMASNREWSEDVTYFWGRVHGCGGTGSYAQYETFPIMRQ